MARLPRLPIIAGIFVRKGWLPTSRDMFLLPFPLLIVWLIFPPGAGLGHA
jgi:hypothetical protein